MSDRKKVLVAFVDVCGSTRLYEQLGDGEARQRVSAVLDRVRSTAEDLGGRVVKEIGDESMLAFDARHVVPALGEGFASLQGVRGLTCRAGLHFGEVVEEEGDLFGDVVNTAARIAALAGPTQMLLSAEAAAGVSERARLRALPALVARGKRRMPPLFEWLSHHEADFTVALTPEDLDFTRASGPNHLLLRWSGGELMLRPGDGDVLAGRDRDNPLCFPSRRVSRRHLRIESRGDAWLVHDQSTNGTLVKMHGAAPLLLCRDQQRLQGSGTLVLAPGGEERTDSVIHYRLVAGTRKAAE
ncbi:MAG: adenylate/guanylate cyclase domain-containing protein [Gammaproteobacteria bacterium]|nr:MAG: adenylate/guanylate cyclase domain-containing protein [Gammaproteobacteria bacterium]